MTNYNYNDGAFLPNGERNPYYPYPILPDTKHLGPIHDDFPPRPRTVSIEENLKIAEIKDAFLNLRFKVALTSIDCRCYENLKEYKILVVSYVNPKKPLVIVDRPEFGEKRIFDYDFALKMYNYYIKLYTLLIKVETKEYQDIDIYKEQIGYKLTSPRCCLTCKWCKEFPITEQYKLAAVGKLKCTNPFCSQSYVFDATHRHPPYDEHCHNPVINEFCLDDLYHYDPCHYERSKISLALHPTVDALGLCDNYEKIKK